LIACIDVLLYVIEYCTGAGLLVYLGQFNLVHTSNNHHDRFQPSWHENTVIVLC